MAENPLSQSSQMTFRSAMFTEEKSSKKRRNCHRCFNGCVHACLNILKYAQNTSSCR